MEQPDLYAQALLLLQEYQGMHRMRNTPERRQILRMIVDHEGCFTPADVVDWVKPHFISQATVYNTLLLLEKAHIIHCLHAQHNGRLMSYEFALGERNVMQMVCSKCGKVRKVRCDGSTSTALRMRQYPNFIMRHFSVYIFGECKHCARLSMQKLNEQKAADAEALAQVKQAK